MAGINANDGTVLNPVDHVFQSIEKILTTPIGTRVKREWFGNPALRLIGERMTPQTILRWYVIVWALIELFEPRFRVRRFVVNDAQRTGLLDFTMEGDVRPYAHLDWEQAQAFVSVGQDAVTIRSVT